MFDKCRKLVTPFEGMAAHSVQFEREAVIELDIAEEKINSLQQLKAEIAALANEVERHDEGDICMCQSLLVSKLRQLSAV